MRRNLIPREEYWQAFVYNFKVLQPRRDLWEQLLPRFVYQGCFQLTCSIGVHHAPIECKAYADELRTFLHVELVVPGLAYQIEVVGDGATTTTHWTS